MVSENLRVFLSIDIDDSDLISRIKEVQSRLDTTAAKMKLVEEDNIHFTWRFFGDTPIKKIDRIHSELSKLEWKTFQIQIEGLGTFPNIRRPRIIWVGVSTNVEELQNLKTETDRLLSNIGYTKEMRRFTPHATIARVRHVKDRGALKLNLEALANERIGPMQVTGLRMTKSTLTPSGAIYESLWEIPFE
jgi:2'-5' RNA ligase